MGRSKLLASIVVGATVGAALSMLDRTTREKTIASTKKMKEAISYYATNREELQVLVEEKVLATKVLCESVSENVNSIIDKVDEFKELPSTIEGMINDTKSAFSLPDKE
ncbi:gas vesicle protein [Lysinibacillus sp. RC46]|uniref:YtxH domain-containing protein n=1 Tax=Lysinibacillus sp. RC46 TaxID=3156295 RepID=UPI003515AB96